MGWRSSWSASQRRLRYARLRLRATLRMAMRPMASMTAKSVLEVAAQAMLMMGAPPGGGGRAVQDVGGASSHCPVSGWQRR